MGSYSLYDQKIGTFLSDKIVIYLCTYYDT